MTVMSKNEKTTVQAASASRMNMRREARNQLLFTSAQFLLGMAVNLIGQPSETTGTAHAASTVLLGLHVVVAIGLLAGAVLVIRAARGGGDRPRQLARAGAFPDRPHCHRRVDDSDHQEQLAVLHHGDRLHRLRAAVREPPGAGAEPGAAANATELTQASPRGGRRLFSYADAHRVRIGVNCQQMPVNARRSPRCTASARTVRCGSAMVSAEKSQAVMLGEVLVVLEVERGERYLVG